MKTTYAAILAFFAGANAHMIMRTPSPFGSPNSSPLKDDGTDFPCKMGGSVEAQGTAHEMPVGVPQTLSFTGSAVHGGGSCQVSIAKGPVSASTKWMVIQSYEGGCPADTTSSGGGNLPSNPDGTDAGTFQFTIPNHSSIPNDNYILAWTWHNRIGNREMYMNCASITVTGAGKRKRWESLGFSKRDQAPLPDMFKANIGNGCTTTEGTDVQYPNPGSSLLVGSNAKLGPPVGNCGSSGSSPTQSQGGSSSAAAPSVTKATAANTVAPTSTGSAIAQSVGGGFATVSAGGSAPTAAASSKPSQPSASASASAPAAPLSTGTAPVAAPAGGSCNTGDWNCAADGKSFTRCIAGGTWSASIPMAQGMSCTPGVSSNIAFNRTGAGAKRDLRSHVMRRRSGMHGLALS